MSPRVLAMAISGPPAAPAQVGRRAVKIVLLLVVMAGEATIARARASWTHETLGAVWAAPLATRHGIFVGAEDGILYAFEPGGRLRWSYKASDGFAGWPVALPGGIVAAANRNRALYFFSSSGDLKGKIDLEGVAPGPPVAVEGTVYLGTSQGRVVAVKDQRISWYHTVGSPVTAYPAASPRGDRIIVGCKDGTLLALDAAGKRMWKSRPGIAVKGSLVVTKNRVFAAREDGTVFAMDLGGHQLWHQKHAPVVGGLAALDDGVVFGTTKGGVISVDGAGRSRWRFAADAAIRGVPAVTPGWVVVGTDRGTLYRLDRKGRPLGLRSASGPIRGGITVAGTRALFGGMDRRIYALEMNEAGRWRAARKLKILLKRTQTGTEAWRREVSGPVAAGVGMGQKGTLLAGTWGRKMYVLDHQGKILWNYNCGEDVDNLPAASPRGGVAFGCNDGGFYGLKPDGDLKFRYPVNKKLASSPSFARDGTVYFGAQDKRVYALDAAGKVLWKIRTGGDVDSSPRIGPDGMIYIGSDDRHLYAINPLGHILWYAKLAGAIRTRPALAPDGTVYATAMDQKLHALSRTGASKWDVQTSGQILSSPAVAKNGSIIFGSRDHGIRAVSPAGEILWRFETAGEVDSAPAVSNRKDGYLVAVGSDDGHLYILNQAGALEWWYPARAEIRGSIVSRSDGSFVFGTMDGAVVAVQPPGKTPPPRKAERYSIKRFKVGQGRTGPALTLPSGELIISGEDGVIRSFGADHWPRWSIPVGADRLGAPLSAGDTIYVTDSWGKLAAIHKGQLRFRLRLDRERLTAPVEVQTPGGPLVLVGSPAGRLWAVTPDGKVRWIFSGKASISTPPVQIGGTIIVAVGTEVLGLDLTGHQRWSRKLESGVLSGPIAMKASALVGDGVGRLWSLSARGIINWKRDLDRGVAGIKVGERQATIMARTTDGRIRVFSATGEPLLAPITRSPVVETSPGGRDVHYIVGAHGSISAVDQRTGLVSRVLDLPGIPAYVGQVKQDLIVISTSGQVTQIGESAELEKQQN